MGAGEADGTHGTSTASHDWGLRGTGAAGAPALSLPRGKATGGSSAVNATFALRGHPADYDGWALPGWRFADLLPAFRRLERDLDFGAADHLADHPAVAVDLPCAPADGDPPVFQLVATLTAAWRSGPARRTSSWWCAGPTQRPAAGRAA